MCCWSVHLSAQDAPVLQLAIGADSIGVGEPLTLLLTSDEPLSGGRRWDWPQFEPGDSLPQGWEVIQVEPLDSNASPMLESGMRRSQRIVVMAWDSGMKVIEPIALADSTGAAASTAAQLVEVGFMALAADAVPKPMQGFRAFKWTWWERILEFLPYLIGALALAWFIRWAIRRWGNRPPGLTTEIPTPIPEEPAHVTALAMLRGVETQKPWLQGAGKEAQAVVSHAIRLHLHGSFGVKALERTTDEVAQSIRQAPVRGLDPGDSTWVIAILERSDLVKFAKQSMDGDAHLRVIRESIAWIERTVPDNGSSSSEEEHSNPDDAHHHE